MRKRVICRGGLCLVVVLALLAITSCQQEVIELPGTAYRLPADVATQWFRLELKLIMETPGFSPPVASRALAYSGVGLY